jgi:hypothetical protein
MLNFNQAPMPNNSKQVQTNKEVNKVYQTNDLSTFKTLPGNRVPNLQHINRLIYSINKYGMKCNPILVNEQLEVIDGQHRLEAAKSAGTFVYYIIVNGYTLTEVHTLNLNQKNWSKSDYMEGYANMGIEPYVKLREFTLKNDDFSFVNCLALCSNISCASNAYQSYQNREDKKPTNVFEEGTWIGKDFDLAQDWANKLRMVGTYYDGYNRSTFVKAFITLLYNDKFDFSEFMHKLRLQPSALVDCINADQYRTVIEDIYNWRSRNKVNLRML